MDLRKLKTLIDLVAESGIAELEVTEGDGKVRIVKSMQPTMQPQMYMAPPQMAQPVAAPAASAAGTPEAPVAAPPAAPVGNVVKSPMVGTFYRSPAPGKPAYVELGSVVKVAEPVCIIEAMKLLNEIEAGFDGVIKEILVENGQPVEFGQPLFLIA
jgi:acetyl-CoA carboxylase biotin carboxyl carrier protein